jgi:hypothetical protein
LFWVACELPEIDPALGDPGGNAHHRSRLLGYYRQRLLLARMRELARAFPLAEATAAAASQAAQRAYAQAGSLRADLQAHASALARQEEDEGSRGPYAAPPLWPLPTQPL